MSELSGLLISESSVAKHAADILRELINQHTDWGIFLSSSQSYDDFVKSPEGSVIMSICASCQNVLSACSSIPSEHILAVISDLFLKIGECSALFMRDIVLKLSLWMTNVDKDLHDVKYVQECLGSAVISMGPEKILLMIPISLDTKKKACLNTWLIPILKEYTIGGSLQFFVEHIVPLAKSIQEMCNRVHKSSTKKKLLSSVDGLWNLLPAFCHYPTDTAKNFDSLAKILLVKLKEDSSSHEHIAAAIKVLVSENSILKDNQEAENIQKTTGLTSNSFSIKSRVASYHYSQKIACRNVIALASGSMELFKSLIDIFFASPPEKRAYLKETIGCLASVLGSSNVQTFFSSSLTRLGLVDNNAGTEKIEHNVQLTDASDLGREVALDKLEEQRSMMMELATAFVGEADKYFIDIIFDYIRPYLSGSVGASLCEAYQTLSKILKGNSWFVFAQVDQLMNLLLGLESPVDLSILQCRFSCLHFLFVHLLKKNEEKANTKALLILNEIIRFLKDSKEEVRKLAYDTLLEISSSLKNSELAAPQSHHQLLFEMIMGYFSGSPPHIMSGAIAAMSLLIYKDADFYFCVPNLMQSVLVLLENKANEVIKATLGLIKVLVSCLPSTEIRKQLPDIINGILPWSSVRTIVEIVIRKCGIDSVLLVLPDKFKGFVKTITEQSQGKVNSKKTGRPERALEPADPSISALLDRKYSRLLKGTQAAKRKKDSSAHSGKSGQKLFLKRRKRKFEDGSLDGTSENPRRGHNQRKEPKIDRKNKRKRMHEKSVRGDRRV
ncbi:hypothetical protein Taro_050587 [Colocasia esculenta]|uniref:RRP12 HEAT domain-containing protein n=1 Tax=Colocasia esculenta TaxID=4460 RepID=A0A843XEE6_COLES|nr:hypothetical protein [Colocasia esculenta]